MTPTSDIYTDFTVLARLRAEAREGGDQARREVAQQVESVFVSMMLKSMREAGAHFGGDSGSVHQGMYDSQIAMSLSRSGRLGFADMMLREITPGGAPDAAAGDAAKAFPAPPRNAALPARDWVAVRAGAARDALATTGAGAPAGAPAQPVAAAAQAGPQRPRPHWASPEDFARDLWPAASRAAEVLGTRPEAVLAVAALETGWGRHMPARANGAPSNNLFGIKAHGWGGDVARSATLEFENGTFARRVEPFRAYDSVEAAVADFARFVSSQPRYKEALASGGDPVKFVRALHAAGYATDPEYGDKLETLVRSAPLKDAAIAADTYNA